MQLSEDFLIELAKTCLVSKEILEVVKPHLQYSFLTKESEKSIFKYIFDYHGANLKPPTIGMLSESVRERDALSLIGKIREANVYDNREEVVKKFEEFVKRAKVLLFGKKLEESFNSGGVDKSIDFIIEESKSISEFSLITKMHPRIFADFDTRMAMRQQQDFSTTKIATGIPQFDHHTRGGCERGTGLLGIGKSGSGKTTFLRSLGFHAAFRGVNVLHLSCADSTEKEVTDGYDAAWTGVDVNEIKEGRLTGADYKQLEKIRQDYLNQCGEIYLHNFTQFNKASILDCRNLLVDLLKTVDIGLVLFDYLEKFDPGDGRKYSSNLEGNGARKMAVAEKIVGIATEFDICTATVTQASEVHKDIWNDPTKVLTRSNISTLKATIDPFAYCVTLNQTLDEGDADIMRIHEEKLRHHKIRSYESTYRIAQDREKGKFIDIAKTNELYWDFENKQIRRAKPKA